MKTNTRDKDKIGILPMLDGLDQDVGVGGESWSCVARSNPQSRYGMRATMPARK